MREHDSVRCDQRRRVLDLLPLPVLNGERVGVRGGDSLDGFAPHPRPLPAPRAGRGSDRVYCTVVHQSHQNALITADRVGTARAYDLRVAMHAGARLCPPYAPSV